MGTVLKPIIQDTCTFIWLTSESSKLSNLAKNLIDHPKSKLFLSDASIWELSLKWSLGKIILPSPPRVWIEEQCAAWTVGEIPIVREIYYRTTELPNHHKNPFDRIIAAQSIQKGMTLLTPGKHIHAYPVDAVW